jgi:hypothetical protein
MGQVRLSNVSWDPRYYRIEDLDSAGKPLGTVRFVPRDRVRLAFVGVVFANGITVVFVWPVVVA